MTSLESVAQRIRPVSLAREQLLSVAEPWADLLPDGGLARGAVVRVTGVGATTTALGLLAEATATGSWVAVVGVPGLGLVAAHEVGVRLERLVCVELPATTGAEDHAGVVAALLGGVDAVVLDDARLGATRARRLATRARERHTVLVCLTGRGDGHPGDLRADRRGDLRADVELVVSSSGWEGLGAGHGVLGHRVLEVEVSGRGRATRPHRTRIRLGPTGAVAEPASPVAEPASPVAEPASPVAEPAPLASISRVAG